MTETVNKNKQKKASIISEISEKISKAKIMVFTNYKGLTHKQIEEFKRALRKDKAEYAVTKNTLLNRALIENKHKLEDQHFDQPTATLFLYEDTILALKSLAKMIKEIQKPSIKFGIMQGKVINEQEVLKLATLPSKEILLAQLVRNMQAPLASLHRTLNWNVQKFLMTLKAIETKKESI